MQIVQWKKILIVDDDETIRKVCGAVLDRHVLDYIFAADGAEGLELFTKRHDETSVVVSDVSMPIMGGIEMLGEILQIDPRVKAIMMSGYCIDLIVPEDFKTRFSLLQKPFLAAALIEAVTKSMNQNYREIGTAALPNQVAAPFYPDDPTPAA